MLVSSSVFKRELVVFLFRMLNHQVTHNRLTCRMAHQVSRYQQIRFQKSHIQQRQAHLNSPGRFTDVTRVAMRVYTQPTCGGTSWFTRATSGSATCVHCTSPRSTSSTCTCRLTAGSSGATGVESPASR